MTRKIFLVALFLLFNIYANGRAQNVGSLISPGELSSPHAKYEGLNNCTKCHELGKGVTDSKCLECHDKLAVRINNKQGFHANITEPCVKCHSDHKGRGYKMVSFDKNKFDHDPTGYLLKDKHASADCIKCHKKEGIYTGLSRDCISCHEDKHKGQLNKDCSRCHDFTGWKNIGKFKHDTDSKYVLTGKHIDVKCEKCHAKNKFKYENFEECITCHKDPHKGKPACKDCHTTEGWKKVNIDHSKTKYPLTNKHKDVGCEKCHKNNQLKGIPYDTCSSTACHKNPHKDQFSGRKCEDCHTTEGWKPSLFQHSAPEYKGFKLDGKHTGTACEKCHAQGRFKPLNYKTCDTSDCHKDPHKNQFAGKGCETCHTTKGWKPSSFGHNVAEYKGFKLDGKHTDTACEKCHAQGRFKPLNYKTCDTSDCHKDPHKNQFAGKGCETCHTTKGWKPSSFGHNVLEYKGFKLDGKHVKVACEKCHAEGRYKPIATDCLNCHEKDDAHKKELGKNCEKCHNTEDWKKPTMDHNKQTSYPLIGKHIDTKCEKCHPEKKYKLKGNKCIDCHKDIHKGKFKEECSSCHTPQDWEPRKFEHEKRTGFGLKGVHNDILCINCHKTKGQYEKVSRYCNQCHVDPHLNQFGSVGCFQCHSERSWTPTLFNHSKTGYPLVGMHRNAECGDCHKNRIYRNTTAACVGCHLSQYSSAPNHLANGYSHECRDCHLTTFTSWAFNHSKVSGSASCATCHLNKTPPSHATKGFGTSCENCHKYPTWTFTHPTGTTGCGNSGCHLTYSTPTRTADHATNNWTTCETCHKYPTWTFTHASVSSGCAACHSTSAPASHSSGKYGTPLTCENCHKSTASGGWTSHTHPSVSSGCSSCHLSYSTPAKPADHATNNWTTCEKCHKYPTWTFTHPSTTFPLTHKGTSPSDCNACHPGGAYTNKGGCIECHNSRGAEVHKTNQNSGCLSCHPTGKK